MDDLNRELQLRRPADVRPMQLMTAPYHGRHELMANVQKLSARGAIRPIQARPIWNPDSGRWELAVRRLRPESRAPRALKLTLAIFIPIGMLSTLSWWVLTALTPHALAVLCLAALVSLFALARAGRRPGVRVTTITTTEIR